MSAAPGHVKPRVIVKAEYALLTWTAWTCFYGIYDAWTTIPEVENLMGSQLQGQFSLGIDNKTMMEWTAAMYAVVAVVSIWFIYKMGKGKSWARSSFFWSFACEAACSVLWVGLAILSGTPPSFKDWVAYIPDYGLQIYALCLLYGGDGKRWFHQAVKA
jgi:hypothetical protein